MEVCSTINTSIECTLENSRQIEVGFEDILSEEEEIPVPSVFGRKKERPTPRRQATPYAATPPAEALLHCG